METNYLLEAELLKRRQAARDQVIGAIEKPSGGPQFVSNGAGTFYAGGGGGIGDAIGKIAGAYFGQKEQAGIDTARGELAGRQAEGLRTAVNNYQTTRDGSPESLGAQPGDGVGPVNQLPAVAPDPRRAAIEAITSSFPQLQEIGKSDLKDALTPKDIFAIPGATLDSRQKAALAGKIGGLQATPNIQTVGGVAFDANNTKAGPIQLVAPGAEKLVERKGSTYQVSPTTQDYTALDKAPKISVTANVTTKGTSVLAEKLAEIAAKDFSLSAEGAQSAKRSLDSIAKLRSLGSTFTGPSADGAVFVSGVANSLGISVDKQKLANSQTFESESAKIWLEAVNAAGGSRGLVKEESDRIARSVPSLVHSPEGREQLIKFIEDRAAKTLSVANEKRKAIIKAGNSDNPGSYFENVTDGPGIGFPAQALSLSLLRVSYLFYCP